MKGLGHSGCQSQTGAPGLADGPKGLEVRPSDTGMPGCDDAGAGATRHMLAPRPKRLQKNGFQPSSSSMLSALAHLLFLDPQLKLCAERCGSFEWGNIRHFLGFGDSCGWENVCIAEGWKGR